MSAKDKLQSLPDPKGHFELMEVVGTGTYGEVYKGRHLKSGQLAAVKILELIPDEEEEIKVEFDVFEKYSQHPNIPAFFGGFYVKPSNKLWFAMEFCDSGSITDLGKKLAPKPIPEIVISYVLKETLNGLRFLHKNKIIHRDVKGQNILLTSDGNVKLVDFGVSAIASEKVMRNTFIGTPYWMAPEVIACDQQVDSLYDQRADIWSLGITAIEIADTEPPLCDIHPMRALFLIPRNAPPVFREPKKWSAEFADFVSKCLIKDYEKRPVAAKILDHTWLKMDPKRAKTTLIETLDRTKHKTLKRQQMHSTGGSEGSVDDLAEDTSTMSVKNDEMPIFPEDKMDDSRPRTRKRTDKRKPRVEGLIGGDDAAGNPSPHTFDDSDASPQDSFLDQFMSAADRAHLPAATMVKRKSKDGGIVEEVVQSTGNYPTFTPIINDAGVPQMPEIRKFKKKFPTEILCASFWGQNLLVGTRSNLVLLDRSGDGKIYPLVSNRRFKQMEVMESLGVAVALCGKTDKLRAYNLHYFKGKVMRTLRDDTPLYNTIATAAGDLEECTHFSIARYENMKFLCVGTRNKVVVYMWAPRPYYKFMLFKEFTVHQRPLRVDISVSDDQTLKIIFASRVGFHTIDIESGNVINLYVPRNQPKVGIMPFQIAKLPPENPADFLLCFDDHAVCVDQYGDVIKEVDMSWSEEPVNMAFTPPNHIVSYGSKTIDIRNSDTGELHGVFRHKDTTRLRCLCARSNKIFFASIKGNNTSQVYFMVY